jgi:phage tail-like protein
MYDRTYTTAIAIWHFANAWPSKISGPSMKSDANEIGIEELTIVHEGMYRET